MPTPPPLWIETHEAPAAVFSKAFSSGQSATASLPSFMLEADCDRLGGQHRARIREATQRHEIPFKRAFVLRQPGREGLESGHVRAPAQWNAPQIALHLENDSVRNPRTF